MTKQLAVRFAANKTVLKVDVDPETATLGDLHTAVHETTGFEPRFYEFVVLGKMYSEASLKLKDLIDLEKAHPAIVVTFRVSGGQTLPDK